MTERNTPNARTESETVDDALDRALELAEDDRVRYYIRKARQAREITVCAPAIHLRHAIHVLAMIVRDDHGARSDAAKRRHNWESAKYHARIALGSILPDWGDRE